MIYASELVHSDEAPHARRSASTALLDHYVRTAHAADHLLTRVRKPMHPAIGLPALDAPPTSAGREQAMAWFATECPALMAALKHATVVGLDAHACQLAWTLQTYLNWSGRWQEWPPVWSVALEAARRLKDRTAQADAHFHLAYAFTWLGPHATAHSHFQKALALYASIDDRAGQIISHHGLGVLYQQQGETPKALEHNRTSLALARAAEDRHGQASALNAIGYYSALLDDHSTARSCCEQAIALFHQIDDEHGEAAAHDSLGVEYTLVGDFTRAIERFQRATAQFHEVGDRFYEADVLMRLGGAYKAAGALTAARNVWQHAFDIFTDLGSPDVARACSELRELGQPDHDHADPPPNEHR